MNHSYPYFPPFISRPYLKHIDTTPLESLTENSKTHPETQEGISLTNENCITSSIVNPNSSRTLKTLKSRIQLIDASSPNRDPEKELLLITDFIRLFLKKNPNATLSEVASIARINKAMAQNLISSFS